MSACFVWLGRHELLPAQRDFIERTLGGKPRLIRITFVGSAEELAEFLRHVRSSCDRLVVSGTVPLSVYQHLARIQDEAGFEVWYPVMETVAMVKTREEAEMLVREAPERRAYQCYRGSGCKVYEFREFKRLREVKLVLEPLALP